MPIRPAGAHHEQPSPMPAGVRPGLSPVFITLLLLGAGCMGASDMGLPKGSEETEAEASSRIDPTQVPRSPDQCASNPLRDPGNLPLRRLNRTEYNNSVRDLLGDTTRPADDFPNDDYGYGFDNIAAVLSMSPLLVEKYETAAERLVEEAWAREAAQTGSAQARVRRCAAASAADKDCMSLIVGDFARRAWRRPVAVDELQRLMALVQLALDQGDDWEVGVKLALKATLLAPHFLFRVELDPAPGEPIAHPLSDFELAARLSYFLWSSTPDEELYRLAIEGKLQSEETLRAQTLRMLEDPRSEVLIQSFGGQWLQTRSVPSLTVDATLFPTVDAALKVAAEQETALLLRAFLDEDRPLPELLDADFTFVNDGLAAHYGLPAPGTGTTLTRVTLPKEGPRRGLLGQASVLTLTSHASHTSPVRRGKWVLANLLCSEPPPPPPNVEANLETVAVEGTMRDKLVAHRTNPACAACHQLMDPIGLGLENFDAVGRYRTMDAGKPIDPAGELPTGETFSSARELSSILKGDGRFSACVTRKVFTYALGRGDLENQTCQVHEANTRFAAGGHRLKELLVAVTTSNAFRERRGEAGVAAGGTR